MSGPLGKLLRELALRRGYCTNLFLRCGRPTPTEYADILRRGGRFQSIGRDVGIVYGTEILDPAYVRIGNNVLLANCTLVGHDGSVEVLNCAYGVKLDAVGKIDIRDNVFVGHGAIILPGVTIGPNALVAAGAVVAKDVAPGSAVGGVAARHIGSVQEIVRRRQKETAELPWADLIAQRVGAAERGAPTGKEAPPS